MQELRDVEASIDSREYPKNYANLRCAMDDLVLAESTGKASNLTGQVKSIYTSVWQRLCAQLLDALVLLPLFVLGVWGYAQSRMSIAYYSIFGLAFQLWFYIYLVQRFGGTPGKLLMEMRIVRLDNKSIGYKEAFLRHSVVFVLSALSTVALIQTTLSLTDTQYFSLYSQGRIVTEVAPGWYKSVQLLAILWVLSDFVVMLTNKRRRAIHDFIAKTVVVRADVMEAALKSGS